MRQLAGSGDVGNHRWLVIRIVVDPLELPVRDPLTQPDPEPALQPEPEPVPASEPAAK